MRPRLGHRDRVLRFPAFAATAITAPQPPQPPQLAAIGTGSTSTALSAFSTISSAVMSSTEPPISATSTNRYRVPVVLPQWPWDDLRWCAMGHHLRRLLLE